MNIGIRVPGGRARCATRRARRDGARRRGVWLRLDLARRPPLLPRERPQRARAVGLLDDTCVARRHHRARRARPARRVYRVPSPRHPRAAGGCDRRAERRALRRCARRRLEPGRVSRVRHPVRPPRLTLSKRRSRLPGGSSLASASRSRAAPHGARRGPAAAARSPAEADDRRKRAAHVVDRAPARRCLEHLVHALQQHARRVRRHNAEITEAAERAGRDPAEIERSACVFVEVEPVGERPRDVEPVPADRLADHLKALGDAGADEAILVVDPITESSIRTLRTALPSG